jgi:putative two-component system response regulator
MRISFLPETGLDTVSVLLVDDEPSILTQLGTALRDCGYETACSQCGMEAIERLKSQDFDVLLADVVMPDMSGMELLERALSLRKDILAILMSGYANVSMAREAFDKGAADFLCKPFPMLTIPIAIERNLRRRQIELNRIIEQRNRLLLESIKALSAAMDTRETQTARHCERITSVALAIADSLGLSDVDKSTLELAAYMHDIGKIGISDAILMKPDKLSDAERLEMREHPDIGCHILSSIEELSDLSLIIRHHHEWMDGTGYPDGLSGEQIPILSRILAIADAHDAMISDRPYRSRMSERKAQKQLREGAGTQFDRELVDIFLSDMKSQLPKAA